MKNKLIVLVALLVIIASLVSCSSNSAPITPVPPVRSCWQGDLQFMYAGMDNGACIYLDMDNDWQIVRK